MLRGYLAVGLALLGSGVALGTALSSRGPTSLDKRARKLALAVRARPLTRFAEELATLAEPRSVIGAALLASLFAKGAPSRARLVAAAGLRLALESGCKWAFDRHRPPAREQIGVKRGCSMPSGHSLAILPVLVIANESGSDALRGAAIAFSLVVGASRIYLAKHNATDVAAGLLIGSGTACLLEATKSPPTQSP